MNKVIKYIEHLQNEDVQFLKIRKGTVWNHCYFPVIFKNNDQLNSVLAGLLKENIKPRRYFFPSLNKLVYVNKEKMPISENICDRILCFPLYHDLPNSNQDKIIDIIQRNL